MTGHLFTQIPDPMVRPGDHADVGNGMNKRLEGDRQDQMNKAKQKMLENKGCVRQGTYRIVYAISDVGLIVCMASMVSLRRMARGPGCP